VSQTQRWAVAAAVPLVAIAAVSVAFVLRSSPGSPMSTAAAVDTTAAATWPAGARRAPDVRLTDEHGRSFSLSALRGRPVLVTFIDPLCRDFCPTEVQHLGDVVRNAPAGAKPTILAVSVNTAGNKPSILAVDRRKWKTPPQFRWAVGSEAQLARVWRTYHVAVIVSNKTVAGVKVRQITHTEASYLVDPDGFERALFLWPYTADAVSKELRALPMSSS
jgi:cytochrome oxidase Cu insertion factor (SCO1/SenC/PrrC family)